MQQFLDAFKYTPQDDTFANAEVQQWLDLEFAKNVSMAEAQLVFSAAFVMHGAKPPLVIYYMHINGFILDSPFWI